MDGTSQVFTITVAYITKDKNIKNKIVTMFKQNQISQTNNLK